MKLMDYNPVIGLTQRNIMNLISRVVDQGGTVSRVLIHQSLWWEFLLDVPNSDFTGPLEVKIWGIPCVPSREIPPGEVRTQE